MSNLDAVAQCHLIMSWAAEQHSSIFSTLTLKSSFIAACNDIRIFFLSIKFTLYFSALSHNSTAQCFSLKTTSFNFLKASISKLKYLYLFARLNTENTVYLCFHVIYDVVVKSPNTVSFRAKQEILYKATILMSLRFQTVYESFLYYLFTKFIIT